MRDAIQMRSTICGGDEAECAHENFPEMDFYQKNVSMTQPQIFTWEKNSNHNCTENSDRLLKFMQARIGGTACFFQTELKLTN